eukprot:TRINITY_DN5092_c1_g1_i1.p1 TRINITY_DN5092_c1_g1~~TRINITY_DN5092_c1_g1_i1.p1  ORF type:complete len:496 (-),score=123.92 TRINITY_DN5092_c1_g1_i1:9-1364(-)
MNTLPQTLEEQFDYAVRIIQRCFQQKASQTEEELFKLRHILKERDMLLQELTTKVTTLEQQLEGAQVTIQRLTDENGRMSHTLTYLNNEVVRIHSLKRAILDSLDNDSASSLSSHTQIPTNFYNSISSPVRFPPNTASNLYQAPTTPSHLSQYNIASLNNQPKRVQTSPPKYFPTTQPHPKYDTLDIISQIDSYSNSLSNFNTHSPINVKTTPTTTSYQPSQLSFASKYKPFDPSELGLGDTTSSILGKLNLGNNNNTPSTSEISSLSSIKSSLSSGSSLLKPIGASPLSGLSSNDNNPTSLSTNQENNGSSIPPPPMKMTLKPPTLKSIITPKIESPSETTSNETVTPSEPPSIPPPPLKLTLKPPMLKSIIQPKPDTETSSTENSSLSSSLTSSLSSNLGSSVSESTNSAAPPPPQPPQPPKAPPAGPPPPPAPKLKLKLTPPKAPIKG